MARKKNIPYIFWQTVMITGILLGLALVFAIWGGNRLAEQWPNLGSSARTALMMFVLWLVVSSGVRSLHSLHKQFSFGSLLGGGAAIGLLGALICFSLTRVLAFFREAITLSDQFGPQELVFFAGLGLIVGLLSAINLRTKNRRLGNVLEALVIVALMLALLYFG